MLIAVGLQAYLWGFPLHYYGRTTPKALQVGGAYLNDLRKYTELKTAKDKFVVTPNNVTIDAYATFDLTAEPVVIFVPALSEPRWYIVQIGNSFDEIARNIGGSKGAATGRLHHNRSRFHRRHTGRDDGSQNAHEDRPRRLAHFRQRRFRFAESG